MRFNRYIGIDYSGARSPEARLKALQVYAARPHSEPEKVCPPVPGAKNWSRREVAQYCLDALEAGERVIIGIDHNFSLPMSYMERYGISDWEFFLRDFVGHWPTHEEYTYVEFLREDNPRTGDASEFRLCEQWTASAKSAFQFDVQGAVAKSTHAGLPWLLWLRQTTKGGSNDPAASTSEMRKPIQHFINAVTQNRIARPTNTMPGLLPPGSGMRISVVCWIVTSTRR